MSAVADVRVIQPIPYTPGVRPLARWARAPQHRVSELEIVHAPMLYVPGLLKWLDGAWLARSIGPIIEKMHAERPIDALDAHFGFPDGAGCVQVGRRLGIPVFVTLRGVEQEQASAAFIGRPLIEALRAATGCVAVSQTLRDLAVRSGVASGAVQVVHNAIDGATFHPGDVHAARARLGLPAFKPLIVSVGRLVALKRHHVLIDAFAKLRRDMPEATLAIIGARSFEPQYPARLQAQVRALGLEDAVRLVGNLPQSYVVDWLQAADAFALLSSREGCSNAVLEALAVGVPTVATAAGDNALFVRPGENGDIVPTDDAAATARALAAVLRCRDWNRSRISQQLSSQVGSWEVVAERVLGFFRERISDTSSRVPRPLHTKRNWPLRLLSPAGRRGRLLIFTYHRVLPQHDALLPDEADATTFAAQMDWVRKFCNVLALPEAVSRLAEGTLPDRAACITFDDGYANSYDIARPILAERGLPATVFIAVDAVERGIMWNDLVIESIREVGGRLARDHLTILGIEAEVPAPGPTSLDVVLNALKYRPLRERWALAAELYRRVARREPPRLMMTPEMVLALARAGFDIGAHTVNHPILANQTPEEARYEIQASRDWITHAVGSQPASFAYPNGRLGRDYDESHARMVREAGFELAVSTAWGCARRGSDAFHLPRVAFWDRSRRTFWARLMKTYAHSYVG
jgi:glycosyltransferase involved in cell wall biosynthesis/peptidoglycan/xylan/chitin deacetylase (PgdA/CDA1 family)